MKLSDIKANPDNPRTIKDDKFKKLVNSIKEFPKMMELRPLVINDENIVLGGNMRLKALKELGYKDIPDAWVKRAADLTPDEQRRFIIADNVAFGEHDWDLLRQNWDVAQLDEWGMDTEEMDVGKITEMDGIMFEIAEELGIERDYLMIVFKDQTEYKDAIQRLGLKRVQENNCTTPGIDNVGIQKIIKYENLRTIIK